MSLNIKNEDTHRMAQELAALTGESMTQAVSEAVRERLNRLRRKKGNNLAQRLLSIGEDCAKRIKGKKVDHAHLLYGADGLPK